jgi:hypothetical protein
MDKIIANLVNETRKATTSSTSQQEATNKSTPQQLPKSSPKKMSYLDKHYSIPLSRTYAREIKADLKDDNTINGSPELKEKGDIFAAFVEQRKLTNTNLPEGASQNLQNINKQADEFNSMVAKRKEIFGDVLAKQEERNVAWAKDTIPEGEYKPENFTKKATNEIKEMDEEELCVNIISDIDAETVLNTNFKEDAVEAYNMYQQTMEFLEVLR